MISVLQFASIQKAAEDLSGCFVKSREGKVCVCVCFICDPPLTATDSMDIRWLEKMPHWSCALSVSLPCLCCSLVTYTLLNHLSTSICLPHVAFFLLSLSNLLFSSLLNCFHWKLTGLLLQNSLSSPLHGQHFSPQAFFLSGDGSHGCHFFLFPSFLSSTTHWPMNKDEWVLTFFLTHDAEPAKFKLDHGWKDEINYRKLFDRRDFEQYCWPPEKWNCAFPIWCQSSTRSSSHVVLGTEAYPTPPYTQHRVCSEERCLQ